MARQITSATVSAFIAGNKLNMGNTRTDGNALYLHDNLIAIRKDDGIYITAAGWLSNTTKERLNAIPGVSINQKNGEWFLNGKSWDGSMVKI